MRGKGGHKLRKELCEISVEEIIVFRKSRDGFIERNGPPEAFSDAMQRIGDTVDIPIGAQKVLTPYLLQPLVSDRRNVSACTFEGSVEFRDESHERRGRVCLPFAGQDVIVKNIDQDPGKTPKRGSDAVFASADDGIRVRKGIDLVVMLYAALKLSRQIGEFGCSCEVRQQIADPEGRGGLG